MEVKRNVYKVLSLIAVTNGSLMLNQQTLH